MESVRKVIECVFGRLKGHFRILKPPIRFQAAGVADGIWFACCVLHNMILADDGLDRRRERGIQWETDYGTFENDSGEQGTLANLHPELMVQADTDHTQAGRVPELTRAERGPGFAELRHKLVVHFNQAKSKGEIGWF